MKFLLILASTACMVSGQTIEGFVRDANGRPIEGAAISVQGTPIVAHTDAKGSYHLNTPHPGSYSLHATANGYVAINSDPFDLGQNSKKLDLTLKQMEAEFSDEPNFIVAGVTDPTNHGGHGSDTLLRSTETLAKATASLGSAVDHGDALAKVREYQRAAESDPTEPHYFNWGSELLTHRALVQAIEVLTKGTRLFPQSTRMLLGVAVAQYTNGSDAKAAAAFYTACDLNPRNSIPYEFLGKVQSAEITQSDEYLAKLERFAKLQPDNALASYYYAAALWKRRTGPVESLLKTSIRLDPHLGPAYLLLGITYSEKKDSVNAIAAYEKADLDEAHYRLAQEYRKIGENEKAEKEIALYNELSGKSADEAQRERLDIQQFVISLR